MEQPPRAEGGACITRALVVLMGDETGVEGGTVEKRNRILVILSLFQVLVLGTVGCR